MIYGYIHNNKIYYKTDKKVLDNDEFLLIIDGYVEDNYYDKVINIYKKNKYNFVNDLDNYISIYLYDKKNNELVLVNDHIGSKKIYYYTLDSKIFFSNNLNNFQIKNKTINIKALSMYFRHYYIPEPYTIYNDVYKLEHGYYLIYKDNQILKKQYWSIIDKFNNRNIIKDYKKIENDLNKLIINQIKELTKNKKNIGIYLSSGVDSSLVTSLYTSISKDKVNTFTVGYENKEFDESSISKIISSHFDTNHHELIFKDKEALKYVKKIPQYYSEPFADISAVATIALNEFAHKNNIDFALTGDGADQLFCGAKIYDVLYKLNIISKINLIKINGKKVNNKKLFYIFAKIPKKYKCQIDIIYEEKKLDGLFIDNGQKRLEYENSIHTKNIQEKRMILDLNTFMAERVLPKMCIAADYNDIKVLSPYLTKKTIEYSFSIPHTYKYHNRIKKYILRQILYKNISKEYYKAPKKGFRIPTVDWLKTILNSDLKRLSTKKLIERQNIFNYDKVLYMINHIDENPNEIWSYYIFQLWYEKNFKINK